MHICNCSGQLSATPLARTEFYPGETHPPLKLEWNKIPHSILFPRAGLQVTFFMKPEHHFWHSFTVISYSEDTLVNSRALNPCWKGGAPGGLPKSTFTTQGTCLPSRASLWGSLQYRSALTPGVPPTPKTAFWPNNFPSEKFFFKWGFLNSQKRQSSTSYSCLTDQC